jgi:hypothetical protein
MRHAIKGTAISLVIGLISAFSGCDESTGKVSPATNPTSVTSPPTESPVVNDATQTSP